MGKFADKMLNYFIQKNSQIGMKLASAFGADINTQDENGRTALMLAKNAETARTLIEAGADVNAKDWYSQTPLRVASMRDYGDSGLAELIKAGADINAQDEYGRTALMHAKNVETAQALIESGADVNAKDVEGITALMWATQKGELKKVQALIEAGADINAKDENGKTALDFAQIKREKAVESLLLETVKKQQQSSLKDVLKQSEQTYTLTDKAKDDISISVVNAHLAKKAGR